MRKAVVDQEYVERAQVLIVVCSNISRSISRYGSRGKEFYSIIDGVFASMLILFQDKMVSAILELPKHVKPIGYPAEAIPNVEADPRITKI